LFYFTHEAIMCCTAGLDLNVSLQLQGSSGIGIKVEFFERLRLTESKTIHKCITLPADRVV